ncbi:MAG: hypothetical protein FWE70_02765, partial [Oscillospiraceae bacterium]|nr:hypothetical protein [Oscillospiraceae bacterium]
FAGVAAGRHSSYIRSPAYARAASYGRGTGLPLFQRFLSAWAYLLAVTLPLTLTLLASGAYMGFGLRLAGMASLLATAMLAASIATLVSVLSGDPSIAAAMAGFAFVSGLIGGVVIPLTYLPGIFDVLRYLSPSHYCVSFILNSVFSHSDGFPAFESAAMALMAAGMYAVAAAVLARREKGGRLNAGIA